MHETAELIDRMIADPRHGWSIGTFGAVGEFVRDEGEEADFTLDDGAATVVTRRGAIRIVPVQGLWPIAFDTLSSDGETWGQSVVFCLPAPVCLDQGGVRYLGKDREALRAEDRDAELFDMGVGRGLVHFCVRTRDVGLIAALHGLEGKNALGPEGGTAMREVLRAQPHRVMLSPAGRVEVYSPIPGPDGASPEGPHTHLLPNGVASGRTHAANAPIPEGWQPVLNLHPRSPGRDALGKRVPFDAELDAMFNQVLARFGLEQDLEIRQAVEKAVEAGVSPEKFVWPETRRGRAEARIALRRLARQDADGLAGWRQRYDRLPEEEDEAALQA